MERVNPLGWVIGHVSRFSGVPFPPTYVHLCCQSSCESLYCFLLQCKHLVREVIVFSEYRQLLHSSKQRAGVQFGNGPLHIHSLPTWEQPYTATVHGLRSCWTLSTGALGVRCRPPGHFDSSCWGRGECYSLAFPHSHVISLSAQDSSEERMKITPAGPTGRLGGSSANRANRKRSMFG